jgi:hypothetical protein
VFDGQQLSIKETVDAKKQKLSGDEAWAFLKKAGEIVVGRGKKYLAFTPSEENREEILKQCLGRTGNLRAPALLVGDRYIIGFNEEMYEKYVG